ncbi:STAS domain-containing protein [Candidatus Sulfidibacterium hydrothermale]|uniref:STAS domain-containing protein n=1 Tax=Candidatus Sulfidibacterium hydrothermale TaxID=2875962 RepID=UPI001F0ABC7D|nr:STAS domain-containing protein [Candidatus Sulfidibacterium hydrothermale]UBM61081.1 STAS domain-containing protein [Candidatus Sulfidibacterium hydrothermale]
MVEIEKNEQLVIKFGKRLDATNAEQTAEKIGKELENLDKDIMLDVSRMEYISSAGLQVVLKCAKAAKAAGKETYLHGAKGNVLEIFRLSGFLTFLKAE